MYDCPSSGISRPTGDLIYRRLWPLGVCTSNGSLPCGGANRCFMGSHLILLTQNNGLPASEVDTMILPPFHKSEGDWGCRDCGRADNNMQRLAILLAEHGQIRPSGEAALSPILPVSKWHGRNALHRPLLSPLNTSRPGEAVRIHPWQLRRIAYECPAARAWRCRPARFRG